ncbi:alpha/beta hydrolase fold domain-containing protein [Tomitella biformata]|uniref:alpha/beta hydrolase fold domain-containing protein n=1 Tax=Tomitella biformata TaxID=630403 RepID=UPI0004647ABE|nr:alpha/beta hydrolase fold domain-containing protein [Tomitella biformata]
MAYRLDPELRAAAERFPAPDLLDPAAARAASAARRRIDPGAAMGDVGVDAADHVVARPQGSPLRVRVYRPRREQDLVPGILHLHSGGFVMGSVDAADVRNMALSSAVGAVIVAVEYRLAPEHVYPAALDDAALALAWMVTQAGKLGVDVERIALHGRSAGGGLAAALALRTRDESGPRVCFQYLSAPQLDDRCDTASMRRFVDTPMWTRRSAQQSWGHYLGPGAAPTEYAAPARAVDLSGLPAAYIGVMEFDPMRDEALGYAGALAAAGVPVEAHLFPGTFHCSAVLTDSAISRRESAEEVAVLRAALRRAD